MAQHTPAVLGPVEPTVRPRAWQWLNTGILRKKLPVTAEPCAWTPLYGKEALDANAAMRLPNPGSPEASAMIDSVLAEYGWPANPKNAARAGYVAAQRLMGPNGPHQPDP